MQTQPELKERPEFLAPDDYRIMIGPMRSDRDTHGNNGCFMIPIKNGKAQMRVIASDGMGWEHVSVSLPGRCPTWEEMCIIKELFWRDDVVVVQYHPRKSDYVNQHKYCLHLWRPIGVELPMPNPIMVGER